jgi:hypothetical protein
MNRRRTLLLLAVIGLALVGAVVLMLRPKKAQPVVQLKIVRRAFERGRPVVFFRLELADRRSMRIDYVERVMFGGSTDGPYDRFLQGGGFWAPSQSSPLDDPIRSRDTFGVLEPINAERWKLRAKVSVSTPIPTARRLMGLQQMWGCARTLGKPYFEAARLALRAVFSAPSEIVESYAIVSGPITNSVVFSVPNL